MNFFLLFYNLILSFEVSCTMARIHVPDRQVCSISHNMNSALRRHVFLHQTSFWRKTGRILISPELRYEADSSSGLTFQTSNIPLNTTQIPSPNLGFVQAPPKHRSVHHALGGTPRHPTRMAAPPQNAIHLLLHLPTFLFAPAWGTSGTRGHDFGGEQERGCWHGPGGWGSVGGFAASRSVSIAWLEAQWY